MSLAICVGVLAVDNPEATAYHREQFHRVNLLLTENRLTPHVEPESLPDFPIGGS